MTSDAYLERKTYVWTLKGLADSEPTEPQTVVVSLPNSKKKGTFDIGAIAYLKRHYKKSKASRGGEPYLVIETSLLQHRCEFLKKLFETITASGYSDSSALAVMSKVGNAFARIDQYASAEKFLETVEGTREFYKAVTAELRHRVGIGEITPRHAQIFQNQLRYLILISYGSSVSDYITKNDIKFSGQVEKTIPREIQDLRYAAKIYERLAIGISEFLLDDKPFPCFLEMPRYSTYLFPASNHRVTPFCYRPIKAYNHEFGRISTEKEFFEKTPDRKPSVLREDLKKVRRNMDAANINPRSKPRRALACTAMQAFQMLFMMLTGSYISEMSNVEFDGELSVSKSITNKSFRVIKLRAAGRVLQYELAARGVNILRSYLKLREWVLAGREEKYLFFGLKVKSWDILKVREENIRGFQDKKVIGVFMPPEFARLTSRQFRKTKSIFLHEDPNIDKEIVGQVLNHSNTTNERHYMEVSPGKSQNEFSRFWTAVNEAAGHIRVAEDNGLHKKTASGHCDDYLNPEAAVESPPITPDCKKQYGCLFCSHYICHANDEEDAHKLCSLLYVVTGVMSGMTDTDKARELFSILDARVRKILFQIKVKSEVGKRNVDLYIHRVFELGELTPYWENRLQRYEALGLVFMMKNKVGVL